MTHPRIEVHGLCRRSREEPAGIGDDERDLASTFAQDLARSQMRPPVNDRSAAGQVALKHMHLGEARHDLAAI